MNVSDYTHLMTHPHTITEVQTETLLRVLDEFPFFQSARALRLKGLHNQNSFKYNFALKVTATHTTDRTVLFDFITSSEFVKVQTDVIQKQKTAVSEEIKPSEVELIPDEEEIKVVAPEVVEITEITEDKKIIIDEKKEKEDEIRKNALEESLSIGKPLNFLKNEQHSFQEWLQLSSVQPINRTLPSDNLAENDSQDAIKTRKTNLINQFIESNPKIAPMKSGAPISVHIDINKDETSTLMTETLARVYLEQKKYLKAIKAYEVLILKYPEKSSFFADRILDIKTLQHNN